MYLTTKCVKWGLRRHTTSSDDFRETQNITFTRRRKLLVINHITQIQKGHSETNHLLMNYPVISYIFPQYRIRYWWQTMRIQVWTISLVLLAFPQSGQDTGQKAQGKIFTVLISKEMPIKTIRYHVKQFSFSVGGTNGKSQPFWKTVWRLLNTLWIELLYDLQFHSWDSAPGEWTH